HQTPTHTLHLTHQCILYINTYLLQTPTHTITSISNTPLPSLSVLIVYLPPHLSSSSSHTLTIFLFSPFSTFLSFFSPSLLFPLSSPSSSLSLSPRPDRWL